MVFKQINLQICLKILVLFCLILKVFSVNDSHQEPSCTSEESNIKFILLVGLLSALVFCFVGVLPALFIRNADDEQRFVGSLSFKLLLAFAAGSLLGDVFLHLLPEISTDVSEKQATINGLLIILSFFIFLIIEKTTDLIPNAHALGTLNLIANFLDNTAHGSTVVGGFQNSFKFGMVALIATVLHEVPHEFSDFALLLRDGIHRKKAIFLQMVTAFGGTIGATLVYAYSLSNSQTNSCVLNTNDSFESNQINHFHDHHNSHNGSFIMPFTIGGFLYIALVGIIPETIIEEENPKISFLQLLSFTTGVLFILFLTQMETIVANYIL